MSTEKWDVNYMRVYEQLSKYKLNDNYKRKGTKCFFDESRKILVQATPEEKVRQQIIMYLQKELKVPKSMIDTEVNLKDFGVKSRKRIDITIDEIREDGYKYAVAIIECKSNEVSLTSKVFAQVAEYADEIGVNYVFITNGIEMIAFYYSEKDKQYHRLKNIPNYEEIIQRKTKNTDFDKDEKIYRIPFNKLFDIKYIEKNDDFYMIGEDTPDKFKPFIMNLGQCFLDTKEKFLLGDYDKISVVEDCGIRSMSYGNASGGTFDTLYRTILIEDGDGNNQLISFCVISCMKCNNHPIWGNSTGKSVLVVSIDNFEKSHSSLQLNMNKFLGMVDNEVTIKHNGSIAVGNIGSGKQSELKKFIKREYPELINESGEIVLGKIKNDKLLYINQEEMQELIINLIKYALVRDEYRDYLKQLNKK